MFKLFRKKRVVVSLQLKGENFEKNVSEFRRSLETLETRVVMRKELLRMYNRRLDEWVK